jgi:hypothetical protein
MLTKVVAWVATSVSSSQRLNAKVFLSRDQFDTMVDTAKNDPLVSSTVGLRREVSASGMMRWWNRLLSVSGGVRCSQSYFVTSRR